MQHNAAVHDIMPQYVTMQMYILIHTTRQPQRESLQFIANHGQQCPNIDADAIATLATCAATSIMESVNVSSQMYDRNTSDQCHEFILLRTQLEHFYELNEVLANP